MSTVEHHTFDSKPDNEFDRYSEDYHAHVDIPSMKVLGGGYTRTFMELKCREFLSILKSRGIDPSQRVLLDAGCGTGIAEEFLCPSFRQVIGIDCSEGMIRAARDRHLPQCEFHVANAAAIPLASGSVDVIFSSCIFHHADDIARRSFLREFARLLSPQGLVVIFEHNPWNLLTRYVVSQCPVDVNAQLISAPRLKWLMTSESYQDVLSRYLIFFPRWMKPLLPLEKYLTRCPLGGQYAVIARRA